MSAEIRISGLGDLAGDFERLTRAAQRRVLRQAAMAGARIGRDAAKALAPVDEGVTRDSVVAASAKQNEPGTHTAGVKIRGTRRENGASPAFTWRFSELGTSKEPARPWIRPAWDSHEDEIVAATQDALARAIDQALGRR